LLSSSSALFRFSIPVMMIFPVLSPSFFTLYLHLFSRFWIC
jgi:hypothetical protein